VVDASGGIVREAKVRSACGAVVAVFQASGWTFARVVLAAGPLSQWLHAEPVEAGLPAILIETRHVKAAPRRDIALRIASSLRSSEKNCL
jgi:transposase